METVRSGSARLCGISAAERHARKRVSNLLRDEARNAVRTSSERYEIDINLSLGFVVVILSMAVIDHVINPISPEMQRELDHPTVVEQPRRRFTAFQCSSLTTMRTAANFWPQRSNTTVPSC